MHTTMIAKKALKYGTQSLKPGQSFDVDPRHVRVLTAANLALVKPVESKPTFKRPPPKSAWPEMPEVPAFIPQERTEQEAQASNQVLPAPETEDQKPKRTYQRRDMQAKQ